MKLSLWSRVVIEQLIAFHLVRKYCINLLLFIIETEFVNCAVRIETLNSSGYFFCLEGFNIQLILPGKLVHICMNNCLHK